MYAYIYSPQSHFHLDRRTEQDGDTILCKYDIEGTYAIYSNNDIIRVSQYLQLVSQEFLGVCIQQELQNQPVGGGVSHMWTTQYT